MTTVITKWGVGRPDYSVNVEKSVEPFIRSHQDKIVFTQTITNLTLPYDTTVLTAGEFTSAEIGKKTVFYNCSLELKENILVRAYTGFFNTDTGALLSDIYGIEYGYGKIIFKFDKGIPFTAVENSGVGIAFKHYNPQTTKINYTIRCLGLIV